MAGLAPISWQLPPRGGLASRPRLLITAVVTVALVAGLLTAPGRAAAAPGKAVAGPNATSVPVGTGRTIPAVPSPTDRAGITKVSHTTFPTPATATVAVSGATTSVGGLPLSVTTPDAGTGDGGGRGDAVSARRTTSVAAPPASVRVQVADQSLARQAGISGVLFTLSRADAVNVTGWVRLRLDYSAFANAYGANYGQRLRLVRLPGCALSTPTVAACQRQTDLGGVNAGGAVTAELAAGRAPVVLALAGTPTSAGATFSATSLTPAYAWSGGTQGGSFSFNYPLRVPPAIGGPAPDLALKYDSGSVDAKTLAENGQASWVGEGWDLENGFIERSYRPCAQDDGSTGDSCWFSSYNATMAFQGSSVRLVRDNTTGVWHASADNGLRIEQLFDPSRGNGDNDGEYWRVTTLDGTQYFFGANRRYAGDPAVTNSTQLLPVYGNHPGEPCYTGDFASSVCQQGYRWNLDYVVDPRGNSMTLFYAKSSGYLGLNNNTNVQPYDYDDTLDHIDYGTRAGTEGGVNAPMQVWFTRTGRCVNTCQENTSDYPDAPWDLYCSSSTSCPTLVAPVFWTRYKLSTVATKVWDPALAGYRKVDEWNLTHTYPATGDNISPAGDDTSPNLWLQNISHTGYAANGTTTLAEPALTFGGSGLFNRVYWGDSIGVAPYLHYRITSILNGMGGQTLVTYSGPQCDSSWVPDVQANPYRCFPEYFKPALAPAGWGWFHKYVVNGVTDRDLTGGTPDEVTSYAYSTVGTTDPMLWHHDYNESVQLAYRSWSVWQGYSTVTTTRGPAGGPQSVTSKLYFRGMDRDGMATAPNDAIVWNARRVGVTTPIGRAGAAAISGDGGPCLTIAGGGSTDGTPMEIRDCTAAAGQVFHISWDASAQPILVNPATGKCVDVSGAGTDNGTIVQLWTCNNSAAQIWQRQPGGSLFNPNSGKCLEVPAGTLANGSTVDIWDCDGESYHQVWLPQADGTMVQPQARRCLDIEGNAVVDGTPVSSFNCKRTNANQLWRLQADGTLLNPVSGKCLDVIGSATANGSEVQIWTCTAAANQLFTPQADGSLKNPVSGRCLDVTGAPLNGTRAVLWDCTATSRSQKWVHQIVDADATQGFVRESDRYDGTTIVASVFKVPTITLTAVRPTPVAGGQDLTARRVAETESFTRTWLPVSSAYRWTELQRTVDAYGLPTDVRNLADTAVTTDDTCTHIDYARNVAAYLIEATSQLVTTDCAAAPTGANFLAGTQTLYDGSTTVGTAPTAGLVTQTNTLDTVSGTTLTWVQASRAGYDANGRTTSSWDALNQLSTTAFAPASGAPVTAITSTNPMNWTAITTVEPGKGSITKVVDANLMANQAEYDPLGRLTKAWLNGRPTSGTADRQYTYTVSATVPNVVEEQNLGPAGNQVSTFKIYDGRTRLRQVQSPTPTANGGRMIADSTYDGRGLIIKSSEFFNNTGAPSGTLATFGDAAVSAQHRLTYDALERKNADAVWTLGALQYTTSYKFEGDRSAELAPAGGTTTQTFFDARGNITVQRQYQSTTLTGTFQATTYAYDRMNRMTETTDPAGNKWTRVFDRKGRLTSQVNPDTGTSSYTYDNADQVLTTTDGRGVKLAYVYDTIGRRTEEHLTTTTGALLNSWTFDTLAKGQTTSSTSFVGTTGYTTAITGLDSAYRPLGLSVTVPTGEGGLTGTWTTANTYNVDGSPASISYPAAAGMAPETVNYSYDTHGFQLTATGASTYVSAATFQPWGDLYQQTLGATGKRVQVTTDEFAATRMAKSIQVGTESPTTPGTYVEKLTQQYHWDPAGNLTSVDSQSAGTTTDSQCFSYDYLRELTTAWTSTPAAGGCATAPSTTSVGGADPYWTSWTFDPQTGNRTGQNRHGLSGAADTVATSTYPAAAAAKPHSLTSTAITGAGGASSNSYLYDGAGHTTNATINGVSTDYTWTNSGRLNTATLHAVGGDQTTTYVYNTAGDVMIRKAPTGNTLYLGGTEISTNAAGTLTGAVRYYMCNGATVASRTLAGVTLLADDHEGTAQVAVDAVSLATTIRKQDPYGNRRGAVVTWPNQRGYVGGTAEPTGLVSLGARMYDPAIGRFLSADPIFNVGDPQGMNGYSYAENNPTSDTDPNGYLPGSSEAHDTAIALRMVALHAAYPDAIIQGSIPSNLGGPDLVCWGCAPGQVWVWEFKSENNTHGEVTFAREILHHMLQAERDPRTGTDKVVAGPTFASIGLPPMQVGANHANPNQLVRVYDYSPGIQLYGVDENDDDEKARRDSVEETEAAGAIAAQLNDEAEKALEAALNPPQPTTGAGGGAAAMAEREHFSDGAQGGSFFGDVALFAGVIFGALVAAYYGGVALVGLVVRAVARRATQAVVSTAVPVAEEAVHTAGAIGNVIINQGAKLLCRVFC